MGVRLIRAHYGKTSALMRLCAPEHQHFDLHPATFMLPSIQGGRSEHRNAITDQINSGLMLTATANKGLDLDNQWGEPATYAVLCLSVRRCASCFRFYVSTIAEGAPSSLNFTSWTRRSSYAPFRHWPPFSSSIASTRCLPRRKLLSQQTRPGHVSEARRLRTRPVVYQQHQQRRETWPFCVNGHRAVQHCEHFDGFLRHQQLRGGQEYAVIGCWLICWGWQGNMTWPSLTWP